MCTGMTFPLFLKKSFLEHSFHCECTSLFLQERRRRDFSFLLQISGPIWPKLTLPPTVVQVYKSSNTCSMALQVEGSG